MATTTLWSAVTSAQTLGWLADDLGELGDELKELEAELAVTEKQARDSRRAQKGAEAAWMACVDFGKTTDNMEEDRRRLEDARDDAESHRRETEKYRTNLERFHGQLKLARVEVEIAKGLAYDRQLLERYINPMRSAYFPSVRSVLASYDSYTATLSAYQGVFANAGDRCKSTKTIGQWLRVGVQTVASVAAQLPIAATALRETIDLLNPD